MKIELREFPAGTQVTRAGITGGDEAQARRSHILIDGRWVGHVGWDEGEEIVFCTPTTEAERHAVEQHVSSEFGCKCESIMATLASAEPRDRRQRKRSQAPAIGGTDE